jgi:hypothetical protein
VSSEKRCIDCDAPITDEARALNASELWCVPCEKARRARISASMAEITASFPTQQEVPNHAAD